jgi:hypothetical protein
MLHKGEYVKKLLSYALLGLLMISALSSCAVFVANTASQFKGSIPLDQAHYLTFAKISETDAITAAQKAIGTTEAAASASLENDNGYLVWAVVIAGQVVKVDAGTAEVLYQEAITNSNDVQTGDSGNSGQEEQGEEGSD